MICKQIAVARSRTSICGLICSNRRVTAEAMGELAFAQVIWVAHIGRNSRRNWTGRENQNRKAG
jgi:hypothetical protein